MQNSLLIFLLISLLALACRKEVPVPGVEIIAPTENTQVKPGELLEVLIYFSITNSEAQFEMKIVDDDLLGISPPVSWCASGEQTVREIEIPRRTYVNSEIFIKVKVIDGEESSTAFQRLNLDLQDAGSTVVFVSKNADNFKFELEPQSAEAWSLDLKLTDPLMEVYASHLITGDLQAPKFQVYDLLESDLKWEFPTNGQSSAEILASSIAVDKLWFVQRGFGMKSFGLSDGNPNLDIPLANAEFQKDIAVSSEYIYMLENLNGSQDRIHVYFTSTGAFFQDLTINEKFDRIWINDGGLGLVKESAQDLNIYNYKPSINTLSLSNVKSIQDVDTYQLRDGGDWIFAQKLNGTLMASNGDSEYSLGEKTNFWISTDQDLLFSQENSLDILKESISTKAPIIASQLDQFDKGEAYYKVMGN